MPELTEPVPTEHPSWCAAHLCTIAEEYGEHRSAPVQANLKTDDLVLVLVYLTQSPVAGKTHTRVWLDVIEDMEHNEYPLTVEGARGVVRALTRTLDRLGEATS